MRIDVKTDARQGITQAILAIILSHRFEPRAIETVVRHVYLDLPQLGDEALPDLTEAIRGLPGVVAVRRITAMPRELRRLQLEAVLDSLADPLLAVNATGAVVVANAAAIEASGLTETAILGADVTDVVALEDWDAKAEDLEPAALHGQAVLGGITYRVERLPIYDAAAVDHPRPVGTLLVLRQPEGRFSQHSPTAARLLRFEELQGDTPVFRDTVEAARRAVAGEQPVLLLGEAGTGKRAFAGAMHLSDGDDAGRFVVVDCTAAALPHLDSQLFGKASEDDGRFGSAGILWDPGPGTVVLHCIEALPAVLQSRVLDFIDRGPAATGATRAASEPNLRLVATTACDLGAAAANGRFESRLLDRLLPGEIRIPALRDRRGDIPILVHHFLRAAASSRGLPMPGITPAALSALAEADWPENVRQLEDAVWQAALQSPERMIDVDMLELASHSATETTGTADLPISWAEAQKQFEADLLKRLYPAHPSSRKLAKRLKLSHTAVANKLRAYGIGSRS